MNIDLILYLAMTVVAVLAVIGTFLAIAWSMFQDTLPKLPPRATKMTLGKYTVIIAPQVNGPPEVTIYPRSRTRRRKA